MWEVLQMFRVYDTKERRWIWNNVYLTPNGELFMIKQSVFGLVKIPLALNPDRYVYHKAIDLWDKNQARVYEGDYIKAQVAEDKTVLGMVVFAEELSAYIILCEESDEFYTLGKDVCDLIEVVGNVFDGY